MYTFETGQRVGERPAQLLRRLELNVIWLWSTEPVCTIADRSSLLTRLSAVGETVERLAFRHDVHPDEPTDVAVLDACALELDALAQHWPQLPPPGTAPVADIAA